MPDSNHNADLPNVVVIATGGTIAGTAASGDDGVYESGKVGVETLIQAVPEASRIANLTGIQIASIGSQDMNDVVWMQLAKELDRALSDDSVSGAVITHGTDTMEETAFFLNLVVDSDKPVVLTGAMRPATALSADGPLNLYNAVAVAASTKAIGHGVLVVANDSIHGAREVTKTNTLTVQAFESPNMGLLGALHYGTFRMFRKPQRRHTTNSIFSIRSIEELPPVVVVFAHSNMSGDLIRAAVAMGARGIVLAGVGNGNASNRAIKAMLDAREQGVVIVRSTRSSSGAVLRNQEIDDDAKGFVVSDQLNPAKARVLLQLGLTQTDDVGVVQDYFWTY
ncbi:type II asparaginase [Mariniblastus fucicola]|uniref:Putative L-asparaginase n=1 Tax=Mariniblastus fucicola TaxID=980251 RepID=A0A5B9P8S8_9BACT|nr:type II asparaginase [Mariniblastus fucicola]QEG21322.1 putative L-asparaginase [Mariniblastus fucicola]